MIYIFDKQQNIIDNISEKELLEGHLDFKINTGTIFNFTLPINKSINSYGKYVSIQHPLDKQKHLLFRLASKTDNENNIEYSANELAYQELATGNYIKDVRPSVIDGQHLMTMALDGSGWVLKNCNITSTAKTNFYYISNLDAVKNVVSLIGGELVFYVTIDTNKITGRFVDYVAQQGQDTSKVFAYGSNLLTVTKKQTTDSIYTAILPRGKGEQVSQGTDGSPDGYGRRIDISDVVWMKPNQPLDKPKGSIILNDPVATAEWGQINGNARLLIQEYDQIDDVNILIQQAYKDLMKVNHPQIQYSATVADVGNLSLGDTVLIMHSDRDMSYKTRVFEVDYDLVDETKTTISLGDNLSGNSLTNQVNRLSGQTQAISNQTQWSISNGGHQGVNYGSEQPISAKQGDVWYKLLPNGNTEMYYYNGSGWVLSASTDQQWKENKSIQQGANTIFYGVDEPKTAVEGDVWFKTDNSEPDGKAMYTYTGTSWVKFTGGYDASRLTRGEINGKMLEITNVDTTNLVGDIDGKLNKIKNVDTSSLVGDIDGNLNKITNVNTSALIGGLDGTKNPLSNVPADQLVGTMNKEVVNTINLNAEQITSGKLNSNIVNAIELNAGQITSGQLNSNIVNAIELNARQITAGELNANIVGAIELNAKQITSGQLDSNIVNAIELNANQITSGELNSNIVNAIAIDASQIQTGSLRSNIVESIEIDAKQIVAGQIDASKINVYNITADNIIGGTIDANKIHVLNISADNIVSGTISANFIKGGQLDFSQINGININASNITTGNLTGVQIGITNGGKFYANQLGTIYDFSDNPYYYNNQPSGNTDPWIRINQNGVYNLGSDGTRLGISGTVTADDAYIGSTKQYAWYTQSDAGIQSGTNRLNTSAELGMTGLRISQEDADHPEQTGGYSFFTGHGMYVGYNQNNPRFSVNTAGTVYADVIKLISGRSWQSINGATTDLAKLQQGQDLQFYVGSSNTMNLYSNKGNVSLQASGRWLVEGRSNGYIYLGNVKWTSGGTSVQMATDGALTALSSSIKYKTNIKYDKDGSAGEKLLTLDPMTWQDKSDDEEIQKYKETGIKPDHKIDLSNRRYYGMLAEDFDKAGLDDFILRDEETGELHGIQYEKIGAALIPIIRNMRKMILEQQVEIERLKEK